MYGFSESASPLTSPAAALGVIVPDSEVGATAAASALAFFLAADFEIEGVFEVVEAAIVNSLWD